MSVSHENIAKTLTHVYFADAISHSRIADPSYPVPSHDALPSLDFVVQEWPRLQSKWEAWADAATDPDIARQVPFKIPLRRCLRRLGRQWAVRVSRIEEEPWIPF